MADDRSLAELGRAVDRHDEAIRQIEQTHVTEKLFLTMHGALAERVLRIEQADTSKTTGNRAWLLNLAGTIVGVVVSGVITVLIARGGH